MRIEAKSTPKNGSKSPHRADPQCPLFSSVLHRPTASSPAFSRPCLKEASAFWPDQSELSCDSQRHSRAPRTAAAANSATSCNPAFLSAANDLLVPPQNRPVVNVKQGPFLSPCDMDHVVEQTPTPVPRHHVVNRARLPPSSYQISRTMCAPSPSCRARLPSSVDVTFRYNSPEAQGHAAEPPEFLEPLAPPSDPPA